MTTVPKGLYFEDFKIDGTFVTKRRSIDKTAIAQFAKWSGDQNPLHTDSSYMSDHPLGQPIAHGLLVASIATGLISELGLSKGTIVAMLEQNIQYKSPVYPGDTVHVELKVIEKTQTSNAQRGIVTYQFRVLNQNHVSVIVGTTKNMMLRRASKVNGVNDNEKT